MTDYAVTIEEKAWRTTTLVVSADNAEDARNKITKYMEEAEFLDDVTEDEHSIEIENGYRITDVREW